MKTNRPPATPATTPSACKRALFLGLGWLFFALGLIGAVLPVMPTTLFLILALWAFANSSERLHAWLYTHPKFGATLQRWDQHRVIPVHAKFAAIGGMAISLTYVVWFSDAPLPAIFATIALMGFGAVYVLTKPSRVPVARQPEHKP